MAIKSYQYITNNSNTNNFYPYKKESNKKGITLKIFERTLIRQMTK